MAHIDWSKVAQRSLQKRKDALTKAIVEQCSEAGFYVNAQKGGRVIFVGMPNASVTPMGIQHALEPEILAQVTVKVAMPPNMSMTNHHDYVKIILPNL